MSEHTCQHVTIPPPGWSLGWRGRQRAHVLGMSDTVPDLSIGPPHPLPSGARRRRPRRTAAVDGGPAWVVEAPLAT